MSFLSFLNKVNSIQAAIVEAAIEAIQAKEAAKSQWLGLFINIFQFGLEVPCIQPTQPTSLAPVAPKATLVAKPVKAAAKPTVEKPSFSKKAMARPTKPQAEATPSTESFVPGQPIHNWILKPEGCLLLADDGIAYSEVGYTLTKTMFVKIKAALRAKGVADYSQYITYLAATPQANAEAKAAKKAEAKAKAEATKAAAKKASKKAAK